MALSDFRNAIITEDKFSATFSKFDRTVQGSARGLDRLGNVVSGGGLGMLLGGAAGVAGAVAIGKTVWSLGELGAQSLTAKASYDSLMRSVGQSPALLDQLTRAAGGTVTEMKLMQLTNTALAGSTGALSTEMAGALPKLLEAGRAAALLNPSLGDAEFMFQSLITGIKRGSPMLIDNTGIVLKLGEATEAYAESVGKSVNDLTAQERSIAILRGTLAGADTLIKQAGGSLDSMTTDIQRVKVASEELKTAFAEMIAPGVAQAAEAMVTPIQRITALLSDNDMERATTQLAILNEHIASGSPLAGIAARQVERLHGEIGDLNQQALETGRAVGLTRQMTAEYGSAAVAASGDTAGFADRLAGLTAMARGSSGALATLTSYIQGVSAAAAGGGNFTGFLGSVDVLSQQQYVTITQQRIDMERALDVQVAAGILTQQQADYQLATFDKRVSDHIGTLRDQGKAITDTGTAYDDLKSKIGGALRPTFDLSGLTGGLLGGQGGDSFDEAYKRLAAVALRPEELQIHAGDWGDTFAKAGLTGLSPEDAQARAKELVEAYSKGLDFSLIDREKIKDSVRQAIKAEELYQSVVDEIYAEMGKENPKAGQAGYALGTQINAGVLEAAKNGGAAYNSALAEAVSPYVARILAQQAARYEQ